MIHYQFKRLEYYPGHYVGIFLRFLFRKRKDAHTDFKIKISKNRLHGALNKDNI